jgi:hypothetical protein
MTHLALAEAFEVMELAALQSNIDVAVLMQLCRAENVHVRLAALIALDKLVQEHVKMCSSAVDLVGDDIDLMNGVNQVTFLDGLVSNIPNSKDTLFILMQWTLVLNHFVSASSRLKDGFYQRIQSDLDIGELMDTLVNALQLRSVKPFDLTKWEMTAWAPLNFDPSLEQQSTALYAAFVFYRALIEIPGVVRTWLHDCKERQLVLNIEKMTEAFYAPVVAQRELESIASLDKRSLGDALFIRSLYGTVDHEIRVTYKVDEYALEFLIKLPKLYPLRMATVESVQRVGVSEERWRRWMMTCNNLISFQYGTIADAILAWKQNVEQHFAGIEDCSICYSVIGTLDRTLPSKSCRTCRHKFHGGCLYKWFKTSNNATCPLCRSVFS